LASILRIVRIVRILGRAFPPGNPGPRTKRPTGSGRTRTTVRSRAVGPALSDVRVGAPYIPGHHQLDDHRSRNRVRSACRRSSPRGPVRRIRTIRRKEPVPQICEFCDELRPHGRVANAERLPGPKATMTTTTALAARASWSLISSTIDRPSARARPSTRGPSHQGSVRRIRRKGSGLRFCELCEYCEEPSPSRTSGRAERIRWGRAVGDPPDCDDAGQARRRPGRRRGYVDIVSLTITDSQDRPDGESSPLAVRDGPKGRTIRGQGIGPEWGNCPNPARASGFAARSPRGPGQGWTRPTPTRPDSGVARVVFRSTISAPGSGPGQPPPTDSEDTPGRVGTPILRMAGYMRRVWPSPHLIDIGVSNGGDLPQRGQICCRYYTLEIRKARGSPALGIRFAADAFPAGTPSPGPCGHDRPVRPPRSLRGISDRDRLASARARGHRRSVRRV
jgi:hypothetical protein